MALIEKPLTPLAKITPMRKGVITQVVVHCDCGFGNNLFIRGEGPGLSWDHGVQLRNVKCDEWIWQTNETFTDCQFKILANDTHYETGDNHHVACGKVITIEPHF